MLKSDSGDILSLRWHTSGNNAITNELEVSHLWQSNDNVVRLDGPMHNLNDLICILG